MLAAVVIDSTMEVLHMCPVGGMTHGVLRVLPDALAVHTPVVQQYPVVKLVALAVSWENGYMCERCGKTYQRKDLKVVRVNSN